MSDTVERERRRRFQYSLRTLLALMVLVAAGMSWFSVRLQQAHAQQRAVETIRTLGGVVEYDHEFNRAGKWRPNAQLPGAAWMRDLLGLDFFSGVWNVSFYEPRVSDAELECLKGLKRLRKLQLAGTKITDAGLDHVKDMTELQSLGLAGTNVTDAGLKHLERLHGLQVLGLGETNVTDAGLEHLKGLSQLQTLCLADTKVTDAGLAELRGLHELRCLYVPHGTVTDKGIKELWQALPKIREITE
jgi:hypothetical protein